MGNRDDIPSSQTLATLAMLVLLAILLLLTAVLGV